MNYNNTLNLIKVSLSGVDSTTCLDDESAFAYIDWKEEFEFFNSHTIAPLISEMNQYVQDDNIEKAWKESTYSNIYTYSNLVKNQKQILDVFKTKKIPSVVVKGTSAAKYYPKPVIVQ